MKVCLPQTLPRWIQLRLRSLSFCFLLLQELRALCQVDSWAAETIAEAKRGKERAAAEKEKERHEREARLKARGAKWSKEHPPKANAFST